MNNRLMDRFIDLEFTVDATDTSSSRSIRFKTPETGIKPNITLFFNIIPGSNTNEMTVRITNFYSEINIAKYTKVKIVAGYKNPELYTKITGDILDCYIEKPNPEGVTIFKCALGEITDMYDIDVPVSVVFDAGDTVSKALTKIADAFGYTSSNIYLTADWSNTVFAPTCYTETLINALYAYTWLTEKLNALAAAHNLTRLHVSFNNKKLYCLSLDSGENSEVAVVIDKVSNAYLAGKHMVVTAPWLPTLLSQGLFKMNTKFFRGRMGSLLVEGKQKLFRVNSMQVQFSTVDRNEMQISAIDASED